MKASNSSKISNVQEAEETPLLNQYEIKTYAKRWYILLLFFFLSVGQGVFYNTWSPIQRTARAVFKWDSFMIDLLPALGCIGPAITIVPLGWLLDVKGLRVGTLLAAGCQFFGSAMRCIPAAKHWNVTTIFICIGQIVGCITASIPLSGGVLLSTTWFPSNQRTTSTAILMSGSFAGAALSFIVGPLFVDDLGSLSYNEINSTQRDRYYKQIQTLFLMEAALNLLLFVVILIHYPAKPPQTPSRSSGSPRFSTKHGLAQLFRNRSFLLLALLYGASCGVYSGWTSILAQNLEEFNVGQTFAGWLGFVATIGGALTGIFCSTFVDRFSGHLKDFLILLMVLATISILIVCFIFSKVIPFNKILVAVMFTFTGMFVNGALPLFFEFGAEISYPVAEGIGSCMLKLTDYCLQGLFLIISTGGFGGKWMTWVMMVSISATTILLTCVKERYNRLTVDVVVPTEPNNE